MYYWKGELPAFAFLLLIIPSPGPPLFHCASMSSSQDYYHNGKVRHLNKGLSSKSSRVLLTHLHTILDLLKLLRKNTISTSFLIIFRWSYAFAAAMSFDGSVRNLLTTGTDIPFKAKASNC